MINAPKSVRVGMILYPDVTQLDLTGPYAVLASLPSIKVDLLWHRLEPVRDSNGFILTPTATFETYDGVDVLFVPGGPGQLQVMEDEGLLKFIKRVAPNARYITSVCTGSLILGAAGLLKGKMATSHWMVVDHLKLLRAIPVHERIVEDGKIITGAGVTSGIDFALLLVARLFGDETAKRVQLALEYDPKPPFDSGSIDTASSDTIEALLGRNQDLTNARYEVAKRIGNTL